MVKFLAPIVMVPMDIFAQSGSGVGVTGVGVTGVAVGGIAVGTGVFFVVDLLLEHAGILNEVVIEYVPYIDPAKPLNWIIKFVVAPAGNVEVKDVEDGLEEASVSSSYGVVFLIVQ
jgi:hypothetical protein